MSPFLPLDHPNPLNIQTEGLGEFGAVGGPATSPTVPEWGWLLRKEITYALWGHTWAHKRANLDVDKPNHEHLKTTLCNLSICRAGSRSIMQQLSTAVSALPLN